MFFFVPALLGRNICTLGFLERPLCIGLLWSFLTGDASTALPLGLFFELLWLDLLPIGGYIPPMASFPYLILLTLAPLYGWNTPTTLAFPLLLSLPLAYIVPFIEVRLRNQQKQASLILLQASAAEASLGSLPFRLLFSSIARQLFMGVGIFIAVYGVIRILFSLPAFAPYINVSFPYAGWAAFYCVAIVGSFLSLRIRSAYIVFAGSMAGILLLHFF